MTKTQIVSEFLDKNPDTSAADAVAALKKKGVEITQQGFYTYKSVWKNAASSKSLTSNVPAAPKDFESKSNSKAGVLATLQKLEELSEDVGGYGELRKLIDFLEK